MPNASHFSLPSVDGRLSDIDSGVTAVDDDELASSSKSLVACVTRSSASSARSLEIYQEDCWLKSSTREANRWREVIAFNF